MIKEKELQKNTIAVITVFNNSQLVGQMKNLFMIQLETFPVPSTQWKTLEILNSILQQKPIIQS